MKQAPWSAARARELYNLPQWGEGYFDVSDGGDLLVRPFREADSTAVNLHEIARRLPLEGLELPVLVRFNNILEDRVDALTGASRTRSSISATPAATPPCIRSRSTSRPTW